ncbi:MAG: hypothetical protein AAFX87_23585 [Bacteroidota bacterium]
MKEAIIFIPGYDSLERGAKLEEVVKDFQDYNHLGKIEKADETDLYGHTGARLNVKYDDGTSREVDIYEAFWADLRIDFEQLKNYQKFFSGMGMLIYWLNPRLWHFSKGDSTKTVFMIMSTLGLLVWYGIVIITILAFIKTVDPPAFLKDSLLVNQFNELVTVTSENFKQWLGLSVLTSFLPLAVVANIAYDTKKYLQNDTYRSALRRRAHDIVFDVIHEGQYDRVTLLCHSFGSVIGVHFLATMADLTKDKPFRFVTMGAAVSFLSFRSQWLKDILQRCFRTQYVDEWIDFFSPEDWVCSSVKLEDPGPYMREVTQPVKGKFHSEKLIFHKNWFERLFQSKKIHGAYSKTSEVIDKILDRPQ